MNLKVFWPTIKTFTIILIFVILRLPFGLPALSSIGICLLIVYFYQDVVALIIPNTIKMPPLDQQCFLSSTKAHVNYMNVTVQDKPTTKCAEAKWAEMLDLYPKMRYKVKEICGDYYYEMMSKEETLKKAYIYPKSPEHELKCQKDIDAYIRDNMNKKVKLDGPLWRLYMQDYKPDEKDDNFIRANDTKPDPSEEAGAKGMCIFKANHALCDGVSIMCLSMAMAEEYARDYFIKSNDAKWYEVIAIKLLAILEIPKVLMMTLATQDQNYIISRRNKNQLQGQLNISSSRVIDFRLIKALSKTLGVTINDIVSSALSTALKRMFKENDDDSKSFKMAIPANIRFKFYPTRESVVLENKFAALPLTLPLTSDMPSAYP